MVMGMKQLWVVVCMGSLVTRWTWDRINTLTWGTNSSCCPYNGTNAHCCFIEDNAAEVRHKSKFDVIFQDNDLNMVGCRVPKRDPTTGKWTPYPGAGGMDTLETCLAARSASAGRLKAAAPNKAVLDYRGIVVAWWNYVTPDHESWWLKGDTAGSTPRIGVIDWRNKDAADYYVNHVIGLATATDKHIDGVFVDSGFPIAGSPNLTYASRKAMMLAELDAFKRICMLMAAHGKVVTVSLKTHFSNISDQQGQYLCDKDMSDDNITSCIPFGEEKVFETLGPTGAFIPHRQYNIPSRDFGDAAHGGSDADGCVAAIVDVSYEAAYGPVLVTNNDGGPQASEPTSKGGMFSPIGAHNTSLAAYLMAMGDESYFGSGMHWSDWGWETWWPEYNRSLGKPLGSFKREGKYKFSREFERLSVTLDCDGFVTTFQWH